MCIPAQPAYTCACVSIQGRLAQHSIHKYVAQRIPTTWKSPPRWQLERFRNPAAPADPPPSPTLVYALEQLQATLRMLSQHMDAVAFRALWRAVAVAANQLLFNDVVTEASFTYVVGG